MNAAAATELSVVVVTWNSEAEIEQCLTSLMASLADLRGEVFVVDNASTDGTAARIAAGFPTITFIPSVTNLGFAKANNLAIAQTRGCYVLLLNPDTIVEADALQTLCQYMDTHPAVGAVGPRLVTRDGATQRSCLRYVSLPALAAGFLQGGDYLPHNMAQPSAVDALSGAALLVRRRTIEEIGLLDEHFFMYAEDTDWCYRMRQAGWEVHYHPGTTIVHIGGQSAGQIPVETYVRRRQAQLQFVRKHRSGWEADLIERVMLVHLWLQEQRADGNQRAYYRAIRAQWAAPGSPSPPRP